MFLAQLGSAATAVSVGRFSLSRSLSSETPNVAAIDRTRILRAADQYLREQPITITAYASPRSVGGRHDYFSEGDYWWPDPNNPGGPFIQRDGESNPDNFNDHRLALIRFSVQAGSLAAAWKVTHEKKYAAHAASHLRAWFVNANTLMNPNLQYAQAIHGRSTGRGIGIIDTLHLVEVARGISSLESSRQLSGNDLSVIRQWFANYLQWMTVSKNGVEEREAKNNHGTCWLLQVAEFARLTGSQEVSAFCRERFKKVIVPGQIATDGSFPQELRRTKPYGYSIFNLDAMATLCQSLSNASDNLFRFTLTDGRGVAKAMEYMFPFLLDKRKWPHRPDIQYWKDWPVRQPSLLFVGAALRRAEYLRLWRSLDPDPTVPEIIRNYPVRQPVLWV